MYIILKEDLKTIEQIDMRDLPLEELTHPDLMERYIKIDDYIEFEENDRFENGKVVKPSHFYFVTNSYGEVRFVKEFESQSDENYHEISEDEYIEYINSHTEYIFENNELKLKEA